MVVHKLVLDDFYEEDFSLLAIISPLEDYRLAYYLNQSLNINLKKWHKSLDINFAKAEFSIFEYHDNHQDCMWHLVNNIYQNLTNQTFETALLFSTIENVVNTTYLLPEEKKASYFLKLSADFNQEMLTNIAKKVKNIKQVVTCYFIDNSKIKNKDRLIF